MNRAVFVGHVCTRVMQQIVSWQKCKQHSQTTQLSPLHLHKTQPPNRSWVLHGTSERITGGLLPLLGIFFLEGEDGDKLRWFCITDCRQRCHVLPAEPS